MCGGGVLRVVRSVESVESVLKADGTTKTNVIQINVKKKHWLFLHQFFLLIFLLVFFIIEFLFYRNPN